MRLQVLGYGAHVLRRRDQQQRIAGAISASLPVARIAGSSATPGRNASLTCRALMPATTSGSRAHSSTSRPARRKDLRQRRPPGSAADDADAVDLQGRSPLATSRPRYLARATASCLHARTDGGRRVDGRAASAGARAHRADRSGPAPGARRPPRRSSPRCRCTAAPAARERRSRVARARLAQGCRAGARWPRRRRRRRSGAGPGAPSRAAAMSMARAQRSATDSVTAAWKLAAMSATSCALQRGELLGRAAHRRLQAGEGEMRLRRARASAAAGRSGAASPARAAARPRGRRESRGPSSFAVLSKASPSASSMVVPSRS